MDFIRHDQVSDPAVVNGDRVIPKGAGNYDIQDNIIIVMIINLSFQSAAFFRAAFGLDPSTEFIPIKSGLGMTM